MTTTERLEERIRLKRIELENIGYHEGKVSFDEMNRVQIEILALQEFLIEELEAGIHA